MTPPRIAVFAGPTATVANAPDLVTSDKARARHDLPPLSAPGGSPVRYDVLRPQRLAAPATVYVEAFTAHPLEADAADLYAPPDGWLDDAGRFHDGEHDGGGTPVYVVELRPEDGLYLLPYMARQADGSAWEQVTATAAEGAPDRQTFYPDASRIYEEIERFGLDDYGRPISLSAMARFDFFRAAPSAGYTRGLAADTRNDVGDGGIAPERLGEDFFPYYPDHAFREPGLRTLARLTNEVQRVLGTGRHIGAQWLEGSPTTEETMYWLGLVVDTTVPLVGHCAQRRHQALGSDGGRNIVDGVKYLTSGVALDDQGRDRIGAVVIVDEIVFTAREVVKVDARPGGYEAAGGHGGIVADIGGEGPPQVTFVPDRRHTWCSDVRSTALPSTVAGVRGALEGGIDLVEITTKDAGGHLVPSAMPVVTITTYARYTDHQVAGDAAANPAVEVELLARVAANLASSPLAGFIVEGMSPYGLADPSRNAATAVAVFAGMPVVRVGRGRTGGMAYKYEPYIVAGNNLTATKARILLMAALLRHGALPPAADPFRPADAEVAATVAAVTRYQDIFDTH
jgi:hypothetical protein